MSGTEMTSTPYDPYLMTIEEVRALTKPIATYNNTLIDENELKQHIHLSHPQTWADPKFHNGFVDVGDFAKFPIEVIHNIFATTDIQSLMYLRATNSGVKFLIEDWPPFKAAMTDAQPVMMALLATKAARLWTCMDLGATIYKTKCHYCKEHAEVLHLLKMQRVCFRCVTTDRRLMAITLSYALNDMGLTESELAHIPHLLSIPQRSFWGSPSESSIIVDYSAALEVAMTKECSSQPATNFKPLQLHEAVNITVTRTGKRLPKRLIQRKIALLGKKSLHLRRIQNSKVKLSNLPGVLLNPPESSNAQHACCVHLPVMTRTTATSRAHPIRALLCAGCSFYFNYHNALPHQCHTLYPHAEDVKSRAASSPLLDHLRSCPYARLFYTTHITPHHLTPHPTNPLLTSNGGKWTPAQLRSKLQNHLLTLLAPSTAPYKHFQRHTLDLDGTSRLSMAHNNEVFEMLPLELVEHAEKPKPAPTRRTALEMELDEKLAREDATLTVLDDDDFDAWTRERLAELRRQSCVISADEEDVDDDDALGDLVSDEAMSQASWATARPESANCLFKGWTGLLMERKRKTEVAEAKARGMRCMRSVEIGGRGWGMDRFGCVSDLG